LGLKALRAEIEVIKSTWPDCEVLVLSPSPSVQNAMRPNPMNSSRAVATFMRTLVDMKRTLALPEVWKALQRHIGETELSTWAAAR
ncbi:MAG: hypothetical protein ACRDVL_06155, partial [Acidimicrobiia bacterium]